MDSSGNIDMYNSSVLLFMSSAAGTLLLDILIAFFETKKNIFLGLELFKK